jgi:hypothetical protein
VLSTSLGGERWEISGEAGRNSIPEPWRDEIMDNVRFEEVEPALDTETDS